MGRLTKDGDRPSPEEEKAIEIMRLREIAALDQIDGRLGKSSWRSNDYRRAADAAVSVEGKHRALDNLRIERNAQNRILDERRMVMGLIGRHG